MAGKTVVKLSDMQIESIVERVVPLIAAPADHEFFRELLYIKLESCKTSAAAAAFISSLLKAA